MASFISAADAIAAAVEIEKKGHSFYLLAQSKANTAEDKEFFAYMAKEENKHEGIFSSMLKRIGGLSLPPGSSEKEYLDYVASLLNSHCLFTEDLEEKVLKNPLEQAIQFEKDTLLFFIELEQLVPQSEKKFVKECADEERKHIQILNKRKQDQRRSSPQ